MTQSELHKEIEEKVGLKGDINVLHTTKNKVINLKTKVEYWIIAGCINATNNSDGKKMVVYQNREGIIFCRELEEFLMKFEVCNESDNLF